MNTERQNLRSSANNILLSTTCLHMMYPPAHPRAKVVPASSSSMPAVHCPPKQGRAAPEVHGAVHVQKIRRRRVEHVEARASERVAPPNLQLDVTLLRHCH